MKKKSLALVLALVLLVGGLVGGTLAWLTATTDEVVNTFTTSDIDITLKESTGDNYKMVPGYTINKDPKVTVQAGSEKCYLFVKLNKSDNFDDFLTYEMAEGWTQLTGTSDEVVAGVFYRVVETTNMGQELSVLKNDQVTVKDTVTKDHMDGLIEETYPTLTVTAYASQYNKSADATFTAIEAWNNISSASNN